MVHGDELDVKIMDAATALDAARHDFGMGTCTLLVAAVHLAQEPPDDAPRWVPERLVHDRLALDSYAVEFGILHD